MLIFGKGEFASVMASYFPMSRFTVHRQYIDEHPIESIVAFEEATPEPLIIAIGIEHRRRIHGEAIRRGFTPSGFVSKSNIRRGYISPSSIVLEINNLDVYSEVGDNTVLWSCNHVGHHSRVGNHCFVTSHVCIGGGATIGDGCFIGMNATVFDHVKIGDNCLIAAGAVADRDIPDNHALSRKGVLVARHS